MIFKFLPLLISTCTLASIIHNGARDTDVIQRDTLSYGRVLMDNPVEMIVPKPVSGRMTSLQTNREQILARVVGKRSSLGRRVSQTSTLPPVL